MLPAGRAISAVAGTPGCPPRPSKSRPQWTKIKNQSAFATGAIKATNLHGTTMTLCDLCNKHKIKTRFFCLEYKVCSTCAWDDIEEESECPSCTKRDLFGPSPEPALLLPEPTSEILCNLCDCQKPTSAFFCMPHKVCRFCAYDYE